MIHIQFIKSHPAALLPVRGSAEAAGWDVHSAQRATINPGSWQTISTGLRCVIPQGAELQVRPRSGLAHHHGVTVLNAPGTIDSDFEGELKIILANHGGAPFVISIGDRIAQIVPALVHPASMGWAVTGRDTARGAAGFGSTGVSA